MSVAGPIGGARAAQLQVADEKYSAALAGDTSPLRVRFKGTISTVSPGLVLNPFVEAVHEAAVKVGAKEMLVDFGDLEFCNSSGFKSFIYWVEKVQSLPEPSRYKLKFLTNGARKWQRTSLLALSCFAPSTVEIA